MAIQVARRLGLRVIATASAPETRARLAALGAELVFGYDDFEVGVRRLCDARGLDLVLDGWGATSSGAASSLGARSAGWSCSGCRAASRRQIDPVKPYSGSRGVLGFHLGALLAQPARPRTWPPAASPGWPTAASAPRSAGCSPCIGSAPRTSCSPAGLTMERLSSLRRADVAASKQLGEALLAPRAEAACVEAGRVAKVPNSMSTSGSSE